MTFSMTNGTTTITPWDRIGFASSNDAGNVVHRIVDGSVDVTLKPDLPRAGVLPLLFLSAADAETARQALIEPGTWTITDTVAAVEMTFVRTGTLGAVQQISRARWMLEIGYQELS